MNILKPLLACICFITSTTFAQSNHRVVVIPLGDEDNINCTQMDSSGSWMLSGTDVASGGSADVSVQLSTDGTGSITYPDGSSTVRWTSTRNILTIADISRHNAISAEIDISCSNVSNGVLVSGVEGLVFVFSGTKS